MVFCLCTKYLRNRSMGLHQIHTEDIWSIAGMSLKVKVKCQRARSPGSNYYNRFMALFRDHPGKLVTEENFWTLWCKGRLTEADTPTIQLGATPSGLSSAHLHHPPIYYRLDALPATQPTVSKHRRQHQGQIMAFFGPFGSLCAVYVC